MHPKASALLDAHVRHTLSRLEGEALDALLAEETAALCQWAAGRPVTAITDEVRVRDFLLRNVYELTPTETLLAQIGTLATRALQSPLNKTAALEDLLNVREYDLIVDRITELEDLRRQIVRAVLNNPSVVQLISDLVYNGVKNYLMEDGGLAKRVPGMSSLMKMGKGMMERVGADDALEGALKSYVKRNTRATMELSERLVERAMETPKLKAAARQFWQQVKGKKLHSLTQYVGKDDVEDVVTIGATIWNHFRQTGYARDLLGELVHTWFEHWGEQSILKVLEDIGLGEARLVVEVQKVGGPIVADLVASGHLEARLRAQLGVFYASSDVEAVLAG